MTQSSLRSKRWRLASCALAVTAAGMAGWSEPQRNVDAAAATTSGMTSTPTNDETTPERRDVAAGLRGSKHDFAAPDAPLAEHCVACHGRDARIRPRVATSQAATLTPVQPLTTHPRLRNPLGSSTAICLACHDGTIARRVGVGTGLVPVADDFRMDFRHDHPVGVAYPRINHEFRPASFVQRSGIPLPGGRVECISCHDPHDTYRQPAMLVRSNRRSSLCLSCHIK